MPAFTIGVSIIGNNLQANRPYSLGLVEMIFSGRVDVQRGVYQFMLRSDT